MKFPPVFWFCAVVILIMWGVSAYANGEAGPPLVVVETPGGPSIFCTEVRTGVFVCD